MAAESPTLSEAELQRYSRQLMLPQVDIAGQLQLKQSKVLIVGVGGLGSVVAMYLAAAGIGEIHLADSDVVELSNLQRQIIHGQNRLQQKKTASAALRLQDLNPHIHIHQHPHLQDSASTTQAIKAVDVVLDCSDNFATRYLLNQRCFMLQKPLISGAAIGLQGQLAVFDFRDQTIACYACLYPQAVEESTASCSELGILGPVLGVIGSWQCMECYKLLLGWADSLSGQLLSYDARGPVLRQRGITRDPQCLCCQPR